MIWRAWSFITESKINGPLATLLLCFPISACDQTGISNTEIHYDGKNDQNRTDRYLRDGEIKSLIQNKILRTQSDIDYNGGTLFYPDGTGIIFSEGSIKMRYSIIGDDLCINRRNSYCWKIRKINNSYFKITTNNNKISVDKLEIKPFIR